MDTKRYSFFVIVNVKSGEFEVFSTSMRDYRLRLSAMKSSFKRWANQPENSVQHPFRMYYRFFMSEYEYAYVLDKGMYTEDTACKHVNFLTEQLTQRKSHQS